MSDAFRLAIRPPTTLKAAEWVTQNVMIQGSDRAANCDIMGQYRWWIDPINELQNPETKKVICIAPTGAGKSTMASAAMCYIVAEDAGTLMYASQNDAKAKFFGETKAQPSMRACRAIDDYWPKNRHKTRNSEIIMSHMWLTFLGANYTNFQEYSCRYLFGDEPWRWSDGLIKEFWARHHNRSNRKGFLISQGSRINSELHKEAEKGAQRQYSWRCRGCGEWNVYRNSDIDVTEIIGDDGEIDLSATEKTAAMKCQTCGHHHEDTPKMRRELASDARYIETRPATEAETVTYNFPRSAIFWVTWGELWRMEHDAKEKMRRGIVMDMMQYRNKDEALFWDEDYILEPAPLMIGEFLKADITDGLIENEAVRIMSLDRGGDHFWHMVVAWTHDGEGYIISEGRIDDEADVIAIEKKLKPKKVICDIGYQPKISMKICIRNGWIGIKGDKRIRFRYKLPRGGVTERSYSNLVKEISFGKKGHYVMVSSKVFKDMLQDLRAAKRIILPRDISEEYKRHIECEQKRTVINKETGAEEMMWIAQKKDDNHLFDCLYYNVASAYIMGVFGESYEERHAESSVEAQENSD